MKFQGKGREPASVPAGHPSPGHRKEGQREAPPRGDPRPGPNPTPPPHPPPNKYELPQFESEFHGPQEKGSDMWRVIRVGL